MGHIWISESISLLMPFTGPKDPVVYLGGLTGSVKGHL